VVGRLGRLAGAGAGVVTVASLGTVDFFALRDEAVRWGNAAARGWRSQVRGLSRYDRTDRLVAAHTVIVVVAFFEALEEVLAERGVDLADARLTAAEQAVLATASPAAGDYPSIIETLLRHPAPCPTPRTPFGTLQTELGRYYIRMAARQCRRARRPGHPKILEPELEADLRHLLSPEDWSPGPGGPHNLPLTAGQLLVGRFFVIHESRASRDTGPAERSFEFLHATFGEFLAARLYMMTPYWRVFGDMLSTTRARDGIPTSATSSRCFSANSAGPARRTRPGLTAGSCWTRPGRYGRRLPNTSPRVAGRSCWPGYSTSSHPTGRECTTT